MPAGADIITLSAGPCLSFSSPVSAFVYYAKIICLISAYDKKTAMLMNAIGMKAEQQQRRSNHACRLSSIELFSLTFVNFSLHV